MIRHLLAALLLSTTAARAQDAVNAGTVVPCDEWARADTIAEPWEDNTDTYANGQIRVALLDMVEPAGGALRLLVISPPRDELGLRQCRIVGMGDSLGFYDMDFSARTAGYDPARGFTLSLPARHYLPESDLGGDDGWFLLGVTVNQQTGEITTQGFK